MSAILRKTSLADALWDSAFKQYLEDCGPKVADDIRRRNHGPQDLLDYIEQRRRDYSDSRYSKILRVISSFGARFKGYQSALDIIAQGVGKAGCFIWGPIRLVLGVSGFGFPAFDLEFCFILPATGRYYSENFTINNPSGAILGFSLLRIRTRVW